MTLVEPIETIEQLADAVRQRGMVAPAICIFELCKPFTGCLRELNPLFEQLQTLMCGRILIPALKTVLSSVDNVERLIQLLECDSSKGVASI